jgi:hypothetical protein
MTNHITNLPTGGNFQNQDLFLIERAGTNLGLPGSSIAAMAAGVLASQQGGTIGTRVGTYTFAGGLVLKWGTIVFVTDANGDFTFVFPTPFPNNGSIFVAFNGDSIASPNMICSIKVNSMTATQVVLHGELPTGGGVANKQVRFDYFAVGN